MKELLLCIITLIGYGRLSTAQHVLSIDRYLSWMSLKDDGNGTSRVYTSREDIDVY